MVAVEEVSKSSLRTYAKSLRNDIKDKELKEEIIRKKILNHPKVKNSQNILIYISIDNEVSTIKLIEELFKLNKNIYAPRIVDKEIEFYKFMNFSELKKAKYNILEPTKNIKYNNTLNSVIIVPALLFDKNNNRLGYGGGYYDRFLKNKNIYKIGICFSEFLIDKIDVLEHDIKMDEVITER